jgi:glycyl-tRNA synthetase beta chain
MVGEFPELQGLMGGYYAAAQGEHSAVAVAIRDHYKPVGQGDDVPTDPVTVAVSLADKLDTIAGFFLVDERPTGSKDPFALRRAALGIIELVLRNRLRMETMYFFAHAAGYYQSQLEHRPEFEGDWEAGLGKLFTAGFYGTVTEFIFDRLKVQQRSNGVRHDLIDAVFTLGDDQPVRLLARVHALQAFVTTEDGKNLLAGYKRAANILKKEAPSSSPAKAGGQGLSAAEIREGAGVDPHLRGGTDGEGVQNSLSYTLDPAEAALQSALDTAEPRATAAIAGEDFAAAMAALASLRAPIDAFFDSVIVNDPDPAKRSARLALLERIRAAVHNVADFSKIEG